MKCKTETDVIAISTQDILIAATQASQTIAGWEVTILTHKEQLSELRLRLADLETQTQDLQNQNNEQKGVIRYLEQNRTAQTTPAPTSAKTAKFPDPDQFSDEKTGPDYESWKIQIQNKLTVNHDLFLTESAKMAYIFGRTKGDAQGYLKSRYGTDVDAPFESTQEMIKHLDGIYLDPFKV